MRDLTRAFLIVATLWMGSGCGRKDQPDPIKTAGTAKSTASIVGYWSGDLAVPGNSFRLGFDVLPGDGPQFKAALDSFDQGLRDWPATAIQEGDRVVLDVDLKQSGLAKFEGQLSADGQTLEGNWRQGAGTFPLTLELSDKAQVIKEATAPAALSPDELAQNKAAASSLSGTWAGALNAGGKELRIEFSITPNPDGTCSTAMKSLDQGGAAIPVKLTLLDQSEVTFDVPGIRGKFVGTYDAGGKIMDGLWTQGPANLPLVLEKK